MAESTISLEVAGRTYTVPQPPARIGLALQAAFVVSHARRVGKTPPPYAIERLSRYDSGESELDEDALGPVWEQMIEDDVPLNDLRRAARAAYIWICTGSESAAQKHLDPDSEAGDEGPKA